MKLTINGQAHDVDAAPDTPLLWVLRDHLHMTGTKFGCGKAQCGACTVYLDGSPVRSCMFPVSGVQSREVTTIEGLSGPAADAVRRAWQALDVPQCGYCQTGMIMAVAALLEKNPDPTDEDINAEITNICRCGTYRRVRKGIHLAADQKA